MNNNELQALIYQIGNEQSRVAFNNIFDFFAPRIIGYLVGSGTQKEVAEEITQEVLTTVWQKSVQFDYKKGNVSTWIFTIARNKRIDRIRKNENPTYNKLDLIDALYPNNNNSDNNLRYEINNIQDKLSENDRKLIKMNFSEGKTHKNISRDLEIPLGTVKSRIRNILTKIKKF